MTAAVNGTDERLDQSAGLLREVLAELRQANAVTTVDVTPGTGDRPAGTPPKRRK